MRTRFPSLSIYFVSLMVLLVGLWVPVAAQTTCARVKLRIQQELTFERVAFDAQMVLTNNLPADALENLSASIAIEDANGDPADALFFIAPPVLSNITGGIGGSGRIEAAQTGEVSWLIIPTVGAGGTVPEGQEYLVTVDLVLGPEGQPAVPITVVPDSITVRPQPLLDLDYFFPALVLGDNPLTNLVVEEVVPFTFGLRTVNRGHGTAANMKIKTSQPEIIENELGLLVAFQILGTSVNDAPQSPSLLADLGTLDPDETVSARWTMTSSLLGEFIEFSASYQHADELGGLKTSLIDSLDTHTLVRNARIDVPADDGIRDFLASSDADVDHLPDSLFSSEGDEFPVEFRAANASNAVTPGTPSTTVTFTSPGASWAAIRIEDPADGNMALTQVVRSDAKVLHPDNAWVEMLNVPGGSSTDIAPYFQLLDHGSTGNYTLHYRVPTTLDDPGDKTVLAANNLQFTLSSTVAAGLTPGYSMVFVDSIPGGPQPTLNPLSGLFSWTPNTAQIGLYHVTFTVTDDGTPVLSDSETITISVDNPDLVVDAGPDRVALPGQKVQIDARASQGPSPLTYSWTQTAGPFVVLVDPTGPLPHFTAPAVASNTLITWELELTDGLLRSGTDTMNAVIAVSSPLAQAGPDQIVEGATLVQLDGSASTGDSLDFEWLQLSGPAVTLDGATTDSPTFTAPALSSSATCQFRLTVIDAVGLTSTDTVSITVNPSEVPLVDLDADGKPDQFETDDVLALKQAGTNTTNLAIKDSDGDGLLDGEENPFGAFVTVPLRALSHPRDRDTDNDGWFDGLELLYPTTFPNGPLVPDTGKIDNDGDGLPSTLDPNDSNADSDGDQYADAYEVVMLKNPSSAASRPDLGDVDNSGATDLVDVALLADLNLGVVALDDQSNADMNSDGVFDVADVAIIVDMNLGLVVVP